MITVRELEALGAEGEPLELSLHLPSGEGRVPLVAICHGFKGFKDWGFFPPLADDLASAGLAALRIDFSHNGTGRGAEAGEFTRLDLFERDRMSFRLLDLAESVRHALAREPRLDRHRLAVLGHSLGGAVALLAAKSIPFRAIVTLASVDRVEFPPDQAAILERDGRLLVPNARTGQLMPVGIAALRDLRSHRDEYDLDAAARLLGCPWLLVHGTADASVPIVASKRLAALGAKETTRLLTLEGADHAFGCSHPHGRRSRTFDKVAEAVIAFLDEHLGQAGAVKDE